MNPVPKQVESLPTSYVSVSLKTSREKTRFPSTAATGASIDASTVSAST